MSTTAAGTSLAHDLESADIAAAMRQARSDLETAAETARAEQDPLAPVLAGLSSSLRVMVAVQARMEAGREPLDAKARAEITRQLVKACRGDFLRQAGAQSHWRAALSGVCATVLLLGTFSGGYAVGHSVETSDVRESTGIIRAALSEGSTSARAWTDAIRRNDLVGLLARCERHAVWADASGRRACAVPLWLEDAPPPAAATGPCS